MAKAKSNSLSMVLNMAMILSLFVIIAMVESRSLIGTFSKSKPTCVSVVGVKSGDTCLDIASTYKLSIEYFDFVNPNLNCEKLFVGQWLCVNGK